MAFRELVDRQINRVYGPVGTAGAGEHRAIVRLPGAARDRTEFRRTPDGWKFVITEAQVDACLARVASAPAR